MFPVIRNSFLTQRVNLISDSFSLWKARRINRGGYATPFLKRRGIYQAAHIDIRIQEREKGHCHAMNTIQFHGA
ncbi:hypothetical protein KP509_09G080600 [Ceratopteris richardii]|uniref:Uncharacterized protein n=1 Tax=Ceratopteris richardii TaxID=49495 RepID=A0A8T2U8Y9_CERRI|nr:hypothetical protein KP509_09G080600 [Ceratopteris richardii]